MPEAKYLLVGSSHAALEALRAIRQSDPDGSMAMLTQDRAMPYSPTILPYVVSGRSKPEAVSLRDEAFFDANRCAFVSQARAVGLEPKARTLRLENGETWRYQRLLIATGAAPALPPVDGLDGVRFHVLRSLADAQALRAAMGGAKTALVLGAGLVGLHAAETLAEGGLAVQVVEMQPHVLPGYLDPVASGLIEDSFTAHGVRLHLGRRVIAVVAEDGGQSCRATLDDGKVVEADLLLVATGVRPVIGWLAGSGVTTDKGVVVDELMRTTVDDIWAAGDVAQALDFHTGRPGLIGIIPTAVEQGRLAGRGMAGDSYAKPYPGGLPVNTYRFFGRVALSIGQAAADGEVVSCSEGGYRRMVFTDDRLVGYASVDQPFDVGIMGELIRRRVDLGPVKDSFIARPLETGRRLMSEQWR